MKLFRISQFFMLFVPGVWLGLVIGISFLEAPLKFQAPGITLELGLGIGRLVFGALNKEVVELLILFVLGFWMKGPEPKVR
ncbi:MAG: hypothetical protein AAGJ81_12845 [Verrucomicrobiota bacterium]